MGARFRFAQTSTSGQISTQQYTTFCKSLNIKELLPVFKLAAMYLLTKLSARVFPARCPRPAGCGRRRGVVE